MNARCTVVLVEDDPDAQLLLQLALTRSSRFEHAATAGTLAEARTVLRSTAPDVVVIDRMLPDGDGQDHLTELRALAPDAVVIVLSAQLPRLAEAPALDAGADAYLDKSTLHEFVVALEATVDRCRGALAA